MLLLGLILLCIPSGILCIEFEEQGKLLKSVGIFLITVIGTIMFTYGGLKIQASENPDCKSKFEKIEGTNVYRKIK